MVKRWWLSLWMLGCAACVATPANGTAVSDRSAAIDFRGYDLTPNARVTLSSATGRTGAFVPFASATTGTEPVTMPDGSKLYAWQVRAPVPSWRGVCGGSEAFVRVTSAGGYALLTYDAAGADGSPAGTACVAESISAGTSTLAAMSSCASPESPIIRLRSPSGGLPTTRTGDVTVHTQVDADAIACVQELRGSLRVAPSAAVDIALPRLRAVTGNVDLAWVRDPAVSSFLPVVRSIDLSALQRIGGNLTGRYLGISADYIEFSMGLDALTDVGGDIDLALQNTSNGTIGGLRALLHHGGNLTVVGGTGDAGLGGLLPALTSVEGNVLVRTGHSTYGMLRGLTRVAQAVRIEGTLFQTAGLSNSLPLLQTVGGDFELREVGRVGTPAIAPVLQTVGGVLRVDHGHPWRLTDLLVGVASGLEVNGLVLRDNAALATFRNANLHVRGSGPIEIVGNPGLPACAPEDFVALQTSDGWTGSSTISGNAPCP